MSSRWISMSFSGRLTPETGVDVGVGGLDERRLAHAARAHKSALLADNPRAKRSVLSARRSRSRSMPRKSAISTRLTLCTGSKCGALAKDESVGRREVRRRPRGGNEPFERRRDALQRVGSAGIGGISEVFGAGHRAYRSEKDRKLRAALEHGRRRLARRGASSYCPNPAPPAPPLLSGRHSL